MNKLIDQWKEEWFFFFLSFLAQQEPGDIIMTNISVTIASASCHISSISHKLVTVYPDNSDQHEPET